MSAGRLDWPAWRLEVWAADEARWYRVGYMRPSLLGEAVWRGLNL